MKTRNSSKSYNKLRFTAALLLIWQFTLSAVIAQSSSPSKSPSAANDEPKLTAGNVDTSKYPATTVNFTVEKEGSVFRELETKDVEVFIDNQKVELKPDALKKAKDSEGVKILFAIDKSGSMKIGADKLQAAKDALRNFVNNLSPQDEVAISTFGVDYERVLPLTKVENKTLINGAIDGIIAPDDFTNFYGGVDKAVEQADQAGVKKIIFLSDGKEDNKDFNLVKDKTAEKERREKDLANKMNQKAITFFAVAIGNPDTAKADTQEFVDYDSMKRIADQTQGKANLVDMPEIEAEAKGDSEKKKTLIADSLKDQLAEIKKALKFSYALIFDMPKNSRQDGEMLLKFKITDGAKAWAQETKYPYTVKDGRPIFEKAQVQSFMPALANSNAASLKYGDISLIYLLMLVPLGILSLIPMVFNKFAAAAEVKKVNEAIVRLNPGSPFIGTQCPNESGAWGKRFAFSQGDTLIICPQCGTPHHLACWAENKFQCMTRTCESRYQIPAQVLAQNNVQV